MCQCNHVNKCLMSWPSGKLPFECQKIAKNLIYFFKKNLQKFSFFFKKNCHWQFFLKKWKFLTIFLKKCQVFGNLFNSEMAIFPRVRCICANGTASQTCTLLPWRSDVLALFSQPCLETNKWSLLNKKNHCCSRWAYRVH